MMRPVMYSVGLTVGPTLPCARNCHFTCMFLSLFFIITHFFSCDENSKIYCLGNVQIYNTALIIIVTRLNVTSPGLFLFCIWKIVSFDPLHPFRPLPPAPSGSHQSVLCIYEFGFVCFVLDSAWKRDQSIFVFL